MRSVLADLVRAGPYWIIVFSRRQLLGFAMYSQSRASDSQRERPHVEDRVDALSLSLASNSAL